MVQIASGSDGLRTARRSLLTCLLLGGGVAVATGAKPELADLRFGMSQKLLVGVNQNFPDIQGMHGYDPKRWPEMLGILYGRGPGFEPHARIAAVSNTNVHGLVAGMLGLKPAAPLNNRNILELLTVRTRKQF